MRKQICSSYLYHLSQIKIKKILSDITIKPHFYQLICLYFIKYNYCSWNSLLEILFSYSLVIKIIIYCLENIWETPKMVAWGKYYPPSINLNTALIPVYAHWGIEKNVWSTIVYNYYFLNTIIYLAVVMRYDVFIL